MLGVAKTAAGRGNVALVERPEPVLRPGHVVLDVVAAGICGTDLHIWDDEFPSEPPVTMGHEVSGVVREVGPEVDGWAPGDRVVSETYFSTCGTCRFCLDGRPNLCVERRSIGSREDGAFAPLVVVPARGLHRIPDWLDLTGWITGKRVAAVFADLHTVHTTRRVPTGPVETFAGDRDNVERVDRAISSEDLAHVLLRYEDGSRGNMTISQLSAGRRNCLAFQLDGVEGALAWSSEQPEELWLGHRDRPNELLPRDPALLDPYARGFTDYPAGHAEGFPDTFKQLYRAVYRAVEAGRMPDDESTFPTFRDGHEDVLLGEAVARSAREGRWVDVER